MLKTGSRAPAEGKAGVPHRNTVCGGPARSPNSPPFPVWPHRPVCGWLAFSITLPGVLPCDPASVLLLR